MIPLSLTATVRHRCALALAAGALAGAAVAGLLLDGHGSPSRPVALGASLGAPAPHLAAAPLPPPARPRAADGLAPDEAGAHSALPKPKPAKHPAAHPARKPAPAHHPKPPGRIGPAHYLRSLSGTAADLAGLRRLGAHDAAAQPPGSSEVILLDIGGQVHNGVRLSLTQRFISYRSLVRDLDAYLDGYHSRQRANAPVVVAIGTNNDLQVSRATGRAWARQVINPLRSHARRYTQITVAGADDVEPGFAAGPAATKGWLSGYLATTTAPFVYNGSADGCSVRQPHSHCGGGWRSQDVVALAAGMAPNRTTVLPQIYNTAMARQWAQLARAAAVGHHPMHIAGPLTENRACGGDPSCPTMSTRQATILLRADLRGVHLPAGGVQTEVDLDIY